MGGGGGAGAVPSRVPPTTTAPKCPEKDHYLIYLLPTLQFRLSSPFFEERYCPRVLFTFMTEWKEEGGRRGRASECAAHEKLDDGGERGKREGRVCTPDVVQ